MNFDLVAHIKEMFALLQDLFGWLFAHPLD